MEYLHFLRTIRARIWLALLGAALGALVVVAMWVLPFNKPSFTARGRVLVQRGALRTIDMRGEEFTIDYPSSDAGFWASLVTFATGPDALSRALRTLGLEADAVTRYAITVSAERLSDRRQASNYLELRCTCDRKDLAEGLTRQLVWQTGADWMAVKAAEAEAALSRLKSQLPTLEKQLAEAQKAVADIETLHGGMGPDKEVEILSSSLLSVQLALQNADLENSAGRARSEALAQQPDRARTAPQGNPGLDERLDSVRQSIMDRQIQLAEMQTRRTPEHPAVKELKRQIADLEQRAKRLEQTSNATATGATYRQEAEIAASVYAREMSARQAQLAQRETDLRGRLSKARTDLAAYQQAQSDADSALKRVMAWKANIAAAEAELSYRQKTATIIPQPLGDTKPTDEEMSNLLAAAAKTPDAPKNLELAKADPLPSRTSKYVLQIIMAVVIGFIAGCALIVVLDYTDTTFKNEGDAARLLGCPIIGGIPRSDVEIVTVTANGDDAQPPQG